MRCIRVLISFSRTPATVNLALGLPEPRVNLSCPANQIFTEPYSGCPYIWVFNIRGIVIIGSLEHTPPHARLGVGYVPSCL